MRILHICHSPLPEARIERAALLGKQLGHETIFVGPPTKGPTMGIFDEVHQFHQNHASYYGVPILCHGVQSKFQKIIQKINPDIIHVHDIFSTKLVMDSGYPFVYDDHEYYSYQYSCDFGKINQPIKNFLYPLFSSIWQKREDKIMEVAPIITVSDPITDSYKERGANVVTIPNYPSRREVGRINFAEKVKDLSTVFVGKTINQFCSYRDQTNFVEFYRTINKPLTCIGRTDHTPGGSVRFTGHIPHQEVFSEASRHHIGIIPWTEHPYHRICGPDKVYVYAHSGVIVIVTPQFTNVLKEFEGRCGVMYNYEHLKIILDKLEEDMDYVRSVCDDTKNFARKNLILDNYKDSLETVYRAA